jgi:acyl-CoA thioester hydrolase
MGSAKRPARKGRSTSDARETPETSSAFPALVCEKVRYSDTDRQGHVNNVAFSVFFEAGRVELLFCSGQRLNRSGTEFVLARSHLELLRQLRWPGEVAIGTRIESLGRSSIALRQAIFQQDRCAATCSSVMVLTSAKTGRSVELGKSARRFLERLGDSVDRTTLSSG